MSENRRLLLISANHHDQPYPVFPLGIAYLQSYLHKHMPHLEIRLFDFNINTHDQLAQLLMDFKPRYTGISLRNVDDVNFYTRESFINGYKTIVELIKSTLDTTIIIGGSAFSIYPEQLFSLFIPDFGITGEGEESLRQLLLALNEQRSPDSIEGLVYRTPGRIQVNLRKRYLRSLTLEFDPSLLNFYWDKSGMLNIQTKRGCPYRCIYCTYPLIEGTKVRTLNPGEIVETLKRLYRDHHITYIFFTDSVFNISNDFNCSLAESMIKAGLGIKWGAYFSPFNLDEAQLSLFKKAGLSHIEFGTESLSNTALRQYGKHFTVDEVITVSEWCNKLNIYFCHFMIFGGYGETEETIDETLENSKLIKNTVFFPYLGMRIYPGTRMQELAICEGVIDPQDDLLEPVYYLADGIDYESLKSRAELTGRRWVFPDEDVATFMNRLRARKRKGSLWHYLKK
jgi:radical SAM superfamily enzyme YgiQ (UPF0313 family)